MAVALHGNLKDFGIAEVFQLIGQQRKTGLLEISQTASKMCLAFDGGAVVWATPVGVVEHAAVGERLVRCGLLTRDRLSDLLAESERSARSLPALLSSQGGVREEDVEQITELLTAETVFEVLRWDSGSFHFSAQPVLHERRPEKLLAAEQILMDGLRMIDEWRTFSDLVPSLDAVYRGVGRFEVFQQKATGDVRRRLSTLERVFRLIDGRLSAQRVIDLARLGTFEGTRTLAELREAGMIELLQAKGRPETRARKGRRVAEQVRWWLAAAFPIAVLSMLVSLMFQEHRADRQEGVFPIVRAPIQHARDAFEKRRLRHALEAYRYVWGDWPVELRDLRRTGLIDVDTLAGSEGRPYYYARRGNDLIVLAPKR